MNIEDTKRIIIKRMMLNNLYEKGLKYVKMVCEIVGGTLVPHRGLLYVLAPNGMRLKVKGSDLNIHGLSVTGRWHWSNLIGTGGFDRIILVGEDGNLYYFFDQSYEWAREYSKPRTRSIFCSPTTEKSPLWEALITRANLRKRYQ